MRLTLYHFDRAELERGGVNWYAQMDVRLLVLLDSFRHQWGSPVAISPHPSALGRELGPTALSDHNVDLHGVVLAADVIPRGMTTKADAQRAIGLATSIGFTSIGLYPDWRPAAGLHLGTRPSRRPGDPAFWGAVRFPDGPQEYVSLSAAVARFVDPPGPLTA